VAARARNWYRAVVERAWCRPGRAPRRYAEQEQVETRENGDGLAREDEQRTIRENHAGVVSAADHPFGSFERRTDEG
jgi:hypothetical protein